MDEKEINNYVKTNELNFIKSGDQWARNQPIALNQRNKISNITREENIYPSLVEFLQKTVELSDRNYYGYSQELDDLNFYLLSNDFMIVCPTRLYLQNTTTNQSQNVTSIGVMYYRRTNYNIEKIGDYFYITSDFDLYYDTELINNSTPQVEVEGLTMIRSTDIKGLNKRKRDKIPHYPELDLELNKLCEKLRGNKNRYTNLTSSDDNITSLRNFLLKNRIPMMIETAMTKRHVPNAARVCIAIHKAFKIDRTTDNNKVLAHHNNTAMLWFTSSLLNSAITSGKIKGLTRRSTKHYTVCNSRNKCSERIFDGLKSHDGKWLIAQVVSIDKNDTNLQNVIDKHLQTTTYPKTETKSLLDEKALRESYPDVKEEDIYDLGSFDTQISSKNKKLCLIRIGDATEINNGKTLNEMCFIEDSVFTFDTFYPIQLRKGNMSRTLTDGKYKVVIDNPMDITSYLTKIPEKLSSIDIERIRTRLASFVPNEDSDIELSGGRKIREIQFSDSLDLEDNSVSSSRRIKPTKTIKIKSPKKKVKKTKKKKKKSNDEGDEDGAGFAGLGSLFG